MHIFLVNDDGYGTPGIMALAKAAASLGHETTIVAPKTQQSAKSHSFTIFQPLFLQEQKLDFPNCRAYSLDGTPSDCVRVGLRSLIEKPVDVVISGINNGYNAGIATHYSGTVGAAMEGVFHYLPSIAASIHYDADETVLNHFADYVIRKAETFAAEKHPRCSMLNINAPQYEWKGEVYCPLGTSYYNDNYVRCEIPRGGVCFWLDVDGNKEKPDPGSDDDWLEKGYITLTMIGNFISYPENV